MRAILVGDPFKTSDVGKFCIRLKNSTYKPNPIYINSSASNRCVEALNECKSLGTTFVACNVVNNINLFANYIASRAISSQRNCPITYIVHDPLIEYPAHIASQILLGSEEYARKYSSIISSVQNFLEILLPAHLNGLFSNGIGYEERGYFMLGLILRNASNIVCHSSYAAKLIEDSLCLVSCKREIATIPLAYDMPEYSHIQRYSDSNSPMPLTVGLYGMFFNDSKNLTLLVETLALLGSRGINFEIWLTGRAEHEFVSYLETKVIKSGGKFYNHGFVSDVVLDQLICNSNFVWAYRNPTHGESSGTVLRALANGCCPIVCDVGAYSELPDHLVLKFHPDTSSSEIAVRLIEYSQDANNCSSMRTSFVGRIHSPFKYLDSLCALNARSMNGLSERTVSNACAIDTFGLLIDGYLLPSALTVESSLEFWIGEQCSILKATISNFVDSTFVYLCASDSALKDIYASAAAPLACVEKSFNVPYPMSSRFDYLYYSTKLLLAGELTSSPIIPLLDKQLHSKHDVYYECVARKLLIAFERCLQDYVDWHDASTDESNLLLIAMVNLLLLEIMPLVWCSGSFGGTSRINPELVINEAMQIFVAAKTILFSKVSHKSSHWEVPMARGQDVICCMLTKCMISSNC